jgi:hypothetical protein
MQTIINFGVGSVFDYFHVSFGGFLKSVFESQISRSMASYVGFSGVLSTRALSDVRRPRQFRKFSEVVKNTGCF